MPHNIINLSIETSCGESSSFEHPNEKNKILHYLPNSIKTINVKTEFICFDSMNNMPNKIFILNIQEINDKKNNKLKLPKNMIFIISINCSKHNCDDMVEFLKIKTFRTSLILTCTEYFKNKADSLNKYYFSIIKNNNNMIDLVYNKYLCEIINCNKFSEDKLLKNTKYEKYLWVMISDNFVKIINSDDKSYNNHVYVVDNLIFSDKLSNKCKFICKKEIKLFMRIISDNCNFY